MSVEAPGLVALMICESLPLVSVPAAVSVSVSAELGQEVVDVAVSEPLKIGEEDGAGAPSPTSNCFICSSKLPLSGAMTKSRPI